MKKRLLSLALSLMMVCALFTPAFASFDTSTRESVAVVATCLELDAGELNLGHGSGFFVDKNGGSVSYLVTNHHVIEPFLSFGAGELHGYAQVTEGNWRMYSANDTRADYVGRSKIRVYFDSNTYEEAYIVEYSEVKDVAILKLANSTTLRKPIPLARPDDSMVGQTVFAVGYPGLSDNAFAGATSSWGISDATVTRGTISRFLTTSGTGQENIQIDCDIKPGNSGGPLVGENGAAIGINTWSVSGQDGQTNYAVNISEAMALLSRNGVEFATLEDVPPVPTPDPVVSEPPQESAGVGVPDPLPTVDVEEPSDEPSPEPSEEPEDEEGLDPFIIVLIAAGVLVAVGVIVAVVVIASRKKNAASAVPPAAPQYPPQDSVPPTAPGQSFQQQPQAPSTASLAGDSGLRIQGVTGSFAGRRVALPRQLRIGRDPQRNDLVYPAGTQGISGIHCVLLVENGTVYIKDLGSTYGTFVGGRRLAANETVPLRVGDRFSLGSDRETFQIAQKGGV